MAMKGQKIGLDANCPIVTAGPNAGVLAPTVADPDLVAGTGAGWVRINFVRGPWSAPDDATEFEGHDWAGAYRAIIDGFKSRGLKIYGLIGHDIMPAEANGKLDWLFRSPAAQMSPDDVAEANRWIDRYAHYFGQIVQRFQGDLECVESFNEPDDWHASNRNWIHPEWFARMLQQIYHQVRDELGISQVKLISGPLQGLEINNNGAVDYVRRTYQEGKRLFGWGQAARFPFDGVGYHLYLQREPTSSWAAHEQALCRRYRDYIQGMMRAIDDAEGRGASKKLYMSEIGWESNDATPEDYDFQAKNLDPPLEPGR